MPGLAIRHFSHTLLGRLVCAVGSLVAAGCSSGTGDPPSASGGETTLDIPVAARSPEIWLVVMDDGADVSALQDRVASELEQYDAKRVAADPCAARRDPASFVPVDRSLVVVHPSASDSARYDSPATIPALRWAADDQNEAGRLAWTSAARQALTTVTPAGGKFRALDAASAALTLLSGARAAGTTEEQAVLDSLPTQTSFGALLVLDHEDESDLDPGSYVVDKDSSGNLVWESLTVPGGLECTAPARLNQWATLQRAATADLPSTQLWGCGDVTLIDYQQAACSSLPPTPSGHAIAFDATGSAPCRALVTMNPQGNCHADRGWLDPLDANGVRTPRVSADTGESLRVCEVAQLTGDALTACQTDLSCAGCSPGWCMTSAPGLQASFSLHADNGQGFGPRFVLGSNLADGDSQISLSCLTE